MSLQLTLIGTVARMEMNNVDKIKFFLGIKIASI